MNRRVRAGRPLPIWLLPLTWLLLSVGVPVAAQSTWEGSASIGLEGEFPENGLFAASDSFGRGAVLDVTNLTTGATARVIVTKRLNGEGVFLSVSREAAESLGMRAAIPARVRVLPVSLPGVTASAPGDEPAYTSDPEVDPTAAREPAIPDRYRVEPVAAAQAPSGESATPDEPDDASVDPTEEPTSSARSGLRVGFSATAGLLDETDPLIELERRVPEDTPGDTPADTREGEVDETADAQSPPSAPPRSGVSVARPAISIGIAGEVGLREPVTEQPVEPEEESDPVVPEPPGEPAVNQTGSEEVASPAIDSVLPPTTIESTTLVIPIASINIPEPPSEPGAPDLTPSDPGDVEVPAASVEAPSEVVAPNEGLGHEASPPGLEPDLPVQRIAKPAPPEPAEVVEEANPEPNGETDGPSQRIGISSGRLSVVGSLQLNPLDAAEVESPFPIPLRPDPSTVAFRVSLRVPIPPEEEARVVEGDVTEEPGSAAVEEADGPHTDDLASMETVPGEATEDPVPPATAATAPAVSMGVTYTAPVDAEAEDVGSGVERSADQIPAPGSPPFGSFLGGAGAPSEEPSLVEVPEPRTLPSGGGFVGYRTSPDTFVADSRDPTPSRPYSPETLGPTYGDVLRLVEGDDSSTPLARPTAGAGGGGGAEALLPDTERPQEIAVDGMVRPPNLRLSEAEHLGGEAARTGPSDATASLPEPPADRNTPALLDPRAETEPRVSQSDTGLPTPNPSGPDETVATTSPDSAEAATALPAPGASGPETSILPRHDGAASDGALGDGTERDETATGDPSAVAATIPDDAVITLEPAEMRPPDVSAVPEDDTPEELGEDDTEPALAFAEPVPTSAEEGLSAARPGIVGTGEGVTFSAIDTPAPLGPDEPTPLTPSAEVGVTETARIAVDEPQRVVEPDETVAPSRVADAPSWQRRPAVDVAEPVGPQAAESVTPPDPDDDGVAVVPSRPDESRPDGPGLAATPGADPVSAAAAEPEVTTTARDEVGPVAVSATAERSVSEPEETRPEADESATSGDAAVVVGSDAPEPAPPQASSGEVPPATEVAQTSPVRRSDFASDWARANLPIVPELQPDLYYVQVGAFANPQSVQSVIRDAIPGMPYAVLPDGASEADTVYRVFVGPLEEDEQGQALVWVRSSGYRDAFVRRGAE